MRDFGDVHIMRLACLWEQESVGQEGVLIKVAETIYLDPCECLLEIFEDAVPFLRLNE